MEPHPRMIARRTARRTWPRRACDASRNSRPRHRPNRQRAWPEVSALLRYNPEGSRVPAVETVGPRREAGHELPRYGTDGADGDLGPGAGDLWTRQAA